jgi:hypothetical protein
MSDGARIHAASKERWTRSDKSVGLMKCRLRFCIGGGEGIMTIWIRIILVTLIGSFPLAIYQMLSSANGSAGKEHVADSTTQGEHQHLDVALAEMNRGVAAKERELREIDVKILENKGSILKLEEDKSAYLKDLQAIQTQIQGVLKGARAPSENVK